MASIDQKPAKGNLGPIALRTDHTHPRTIKDIQEDPKYSDRAKRIARSLDDRCMASWKWLAWPPIALIATDLGWDTSDDAGRRRVDRGIKELVDGGDLVRMTLGEVVEWFDSEGKALGLTWPEKLPRRLRAGRRKVSVLKWRLSAPSDKLPILPQCDTNVAPYTTEPIPSTAPSVALNATEVSHHSATAVSHSLLLNVRSLNSGMKRTLDVEALASLEEGDPVMATDPVATMDSPPSATTEARKQTAQRIVNKCLKESWFISPDGSLEVPAVLKGLALEPTEEQRATFREHLPEVLAIKYPARREPSTPLTSEGRSKKAPKVPGGIQADVRGQLDRLALAETTNAEVLATAKKLAAALGPHRDDEATERQFFKWCGQARSRRDSMSVGILRDAFEGACGKSPENRGAVFYHLVVQFQNEEKNRGRSPA